MNKRVLEIVEKQEDKRLLEKIDCLLDSLDTAFSPIQINSFILNDIEFPTMYGKFVQSQLELQTRLGNLQTLYFEIKEKQIKIKKTERDISNTEDVLDKDLLLLEKERLEAQIRGLKRQVKRIIKEARIFYSLCQECPEFFNLSEEQKFELEVKDWMKKTMNNPAVFEERYGPRYMAAILGEKRYNEYLQARRQALGVLPREMFEEDRIGENSSLNVMKKKALEQLDINFNHQAEQPVFDIKNKCSWFPKLSSEIPKIVHQACTKGKDKVLLLDTLGNNHEVSIEEAKRILMLLSKKGKERDMKRRNATMQIMQAKTPEEVAKVDLIQAGGFFDPGSPTGEQEG